MSPVQSKMTEPIHSTLGRNCMLWERKRGGGGREHQHQHLHVYRYWTSFLSTQLQHLLAFSENGRQFTCVCASPELFLEFNTRKKWNYCFTTKGLIIETYRGKPETVSQMNRHVAVPTWVAFYRVPYLSRHRPPAIQCCATDNGIDFDEPSLTV